MELSNLSEEKLITLLQSMSNFDEINYFFKNNYQNKIGIFVKLIEKSQWDGRIEAISRVYIRWIFEKKLDRKSGHYYWTHGQNSGTTEWTWWYEWLERFFKDAESVRSGPSHVTSQPALPFSRSWRDAKPSWGMLSRNDKPPDIWDTHGISGNVFVNPPAPSSSP